jgi:hypothetical protein
MQNHIGTKLATSVNLGERRSGGHDARDGNTESLT